MKRIERGAICDGLGINVEKWAAEMHGDDPIPTHYTEPYRGADVSLGYLNKEQ